MTKWVKVCWIVFLFIGCKKPFDPSVSIADNSRYLVIEGVINAGSDSTFIKLSRTKKIDTLRTINPETSAQVSVESDGNTNVSLMEIKPGTYAAAPLNLDNTHKYRLRIKTSDNKEYLSDFIPVKNAPPIDNIEFKAQPVGVQIYVSTHDATNATRYYRWEFTEDWQFHSKYLSTLKTNGIDSLKPRLLEQQIYDCFASNASSNVIIASTTRLAQDIVFQAPVTIVPANSEKIETKYAIQIKQYALTSDAYTFWENLQKNTEKIGSIFDALPSEIQSNFHCVSNPGELVVGYLSVGNVSYKRIFITAAQLLPTYSATYPCYCEIDTIIFAHPKPGVDPNLIDPKSPDLPLVNLYPVPDPLGIPYATTYSTILCVDCTVRGTKTRPAFWQ